MILDKLYVRFYRSFNFDYLRKTDRRIKTKPPWEFLKDEHDENEQSEDSKKNRWYPFVTIPLDPHITTVVGENESGKTCLLKAIEHGVSGDEIQQRDFCRHSAFFTVEEGKTRLPEFGCRWRFSSSEERESVVARCGLPEDTSFLLVFYTSLSSPSIYIQRGTEVEALADPDHESIYSSLPVVFRIDSKIGLPESVPLSYLTENRDQAEDHAQWQKRARSFNSEWVESPESIAQHSGDLYNFLRQPAEGNVEKDVRAKLEMELAHDLIRKIARVSVQSLTELQRAIHESEDPYAESLTAKINDRMEMALNLSNVWAQDRDFRLSVSPRDKELVFTISDRTGTRYAFNERSDGLRYFLSYYIQYLAHDPRADGRNEILVMDEPDAYLSSQGQQDLLRVFDAFAYPRAEDRRPVQVIYVTHSPFLVDKNHPKRLRVLQKGKRHEGTRVVLNVSRNHYEPLRSSLGSFVAETAFIGNCNIIVEGPSDQILIAGATRHLRTMSDLPKSETLDLNEVTIVNAGGAPEVPYIVYLATGRDVERPTVVALLDSDGPGNAARAILEGGVSVTTEKKRRQLLPKERILQLGEVSGKFHVIEDLVPLELAAVAARRYLEIHSSWGQKDIESININAAKKLVDTNGQSGFSVTQALLRSVDENFKMSKVGFALEVVGILEDQAQTAGVSEFLENMRVLLSRLNRIQTEARCEDDKRQVLDAVQRTKDRFLRDYRGKFTKDEALRFIEELRARLDDSIEGDEVRNGLNEIVRSFTLETNRSEDVEDCDKFRRHVERVQYDPQRSVQTQ